MNSRMAADLDRHITGNYGEDQHRDLPQCDKCGQTYSRLWVGTACDECDGTIREVTE